MVRKAHLSLLKCLVLKKMEVIDNSRMKRTNLIFIIGAEAKNDRLFYKIYVKMELIKLCLKTTGVFSMPVNFYINVVAFNNG